MTRYAFGLLAVLLCMGLDCSSTIFDAVGTAISEAVTDDDSTSDDTTGTTTTAKGIPAGVYTGAQTIVQTLDNVSDAYPAESHTSTALSSYTFASGGHLLREDGTSIEVGDVQYFSSQFGEVAETVTAITVGTNLTQYVTRAEMEMEGAVDGLAWSFSGGGLHTFRLVGGNVVYEGRLDMSSDTSGGAAYQATMEYSATLSE